MLSAPPSIRLWIAAGVLVGATVLLHTVSHGESVVARQPLRELPNTLGAWNSQEQPLQERIVQAVGVSDYANRIFFNQTDLPVQLYVGYYASQRTGELPAGRRVGPGSFRIRHNFTAQRSPNHRERVCDPARTQQTAGVLLVSRSRSSGCQ